MAPIRFSQQLSAVFIALSESGFTLIVQGMIMTPALFIRIVCASLLAILACALQPSAARQEYPAIGGRGDANAPEECRHGHYVIGFKGRAGDWIDQISFECAALQPDGSLISDPPGQAFGGPGGSPAEINCPPRSVINRLIIKMTEEAKQVGTIQATCVDTRGAVTDTILFGGRLPPTDHFFLDVGNKPNSTENQECRGGEALTGFQVNYGKHINALGAICDALHLPAPPPSSVVLAPTTPPQPQGVIHKTGRAVGDPLPPPGPSGPSAFVGVWDTHTGQNGHFRLTFSESNGVLVGKFEDLNGNAQYNGTLTQKPGTEVKADFFYTYEQPVTKGSGSGEFIIMSDSKLMGKIVTNDNPPLKTGWWGNRIGAPPGPDVK
jgi:hypothetical protein